MESVSKKTVKSKNRSSSRLRSLFPSFYPESDAVLKDLWETGSLVIDANVLLQFHRAGEAYRKTLVKSLAKFKGRIFVPHQAAFEYQRNRLEVIGIQTTGRESHISKALTEFSKHLKNVGRNRHVDLEELSAKVAELVTNETAALTDGSAKSLFESAREDDIGEILDELEVEFGNEPSKEQLAELQKEAARRIKAQIPPGFEDAEKAKQPSVILGELEFRPECGDYLVWAQTLARFKDGGKVIYLTDDAKEDWWQKECGQTIGPRRELKEEAQSLGLKAFWMYQVSAFLDRASEHDKVEVTEEVAQQATELARPGRYDATQALLNHLKSSAGLGFNLTDRVADVAAKVRLKESCNAFTAALAGVVDRDSFDFALGSLSALRVQVGRGFGELTAGQVGNALRVLLDAELSASAPGVDGPDGYLRWARDTLATTVPVIDGLFSEPQLR